jgi:polysaccharide export outer membrane protein
MRPGPQVAQPPYVIPASPQPASSHQSGPFPGEPPYTLDSGDRLRISVFGQQGLTNTYAVDAGGNIAMPLIGAVPARGLTTQQLAREIAARLRRGYVRDPSVTAEIVLYRPFFILGEVNSPGQYPYVADMTIEKAIAIAGGFAPRAHKKQVSVRRTMYGHMLKFDAPITFEVRPGDTIRVKERWF